MITDKICLCFKNELTLSKVILILKSYGYSVIEKTTGGKDCIEKVIKMVPDITIIEYDVVNSIELLKMFLKESNTSIIYIIPENNLKEIESFDKMDNFAYIIKPINKNFLVNFINLVLKQRKRVEKLEKEIIKLNNTLKERKELEKAKGLLMKNFNLTEAEAFRKIQKQSMDKGVPMYEVAKAIIIAYDI